MKSNKSEIKKEHLNSLFKRIFNTSETLLSEIKDIEINHSKLDVNKPSMDKEIKNHPKD